VPQVVFGPDYPMQAPEFCFLRPAPLHPHIYSNGAHAHTHAQAGTGFCRAHTRLAFSLVRAARAHTRALTHPARGTLARAGHICLDILYDSGAWSPALTIASVARSLLSMLAACEAKGVPPGDAEYVRRVGNAPSRSTRWTFHDDRV
jgi:ubiquitin-protein ligase